MQVVPSLENFKCYGEFRVDPLAGNKTSESQSPGEHNRRW